jgi:hypothetical protein
VTLQGAQYSAAGLSATSTTGSNPHELWFGDYDLFICVSGWDERCIAITQSTSLRATKTILVLFNVFDTQGLRANHDALLTDFAQRISGTVEILQGSATDVQGLWADLLVKIHESYLQCGRPISALISSSTCPRYHTLALIGVGIGSGYIKTLTIAYSDGIYPEREDVDIEVAFTGGTAAVVAIPGLEGSTSPERQRLFLVSIGFEGWRSMRAVARAEPDRVCVLYPDPGTSAGYVERALADNTLLFEEFAIAENAIVRSHASDAVAAWQALSTEKLERPLEENMFYLCTGTKPHSIALALRAMQLRTAAVLYSVPEEFKVVQIKSGSAHWRFDIESTATPSIGNRAAARG